MKLTPNAAMRARDVSRPRPEHLAEAEASGASLPGVPQGNGAKDAGRASTRWRTAAPFPERDAAWAAGTAGGDTAGERAETDGAPPDAGPYGGPDGTPPDSGPDGLAEGHEVRRRTRVRRSSSRQGRPAR